MRRGAGFCIKLLDDFLPIEAERRQGVVSLGVEIHLHDNRRLRGSRSKIPHPRNLRIFEKPRPHCNNWCAGLSYQWTKPNSLKSALGYVREFLNSLGQFALHNADPMQINEIGPETSGHIQPWKIWKYFDSVTEFRLPSPLWCRSNANTWCFPIICPTVGNSRERWRCKQVSNWGADNIGMVKEGVILREQGVQRNDFIVHLSEMGRRLIKFS